MSLGVISTDSSELISREPATGKEIGRVKVHTALEVRAAIGRARSAQPLWSLKSYGERREVILAARAIVLDHAAEIADLISAETGKPSAEALSMEVVPTLDLMHYFAHKTEELLSPQSIDLGLYKMMGRSSQVVYKPLGVVGIISPWNFPWATPLDEVVMALMAGNAVVLKPSELTPLTALKIGEVFNQAKLPSGLLEIVTGAGPTGVALVEGGVDKIMFTGSVATGKLVAQEAAKHLTPTVLELGGKDPMIVLADANLKTAAKAAVWGAFANAGQACASIERCYVHESVADEFVKLVVGETKKLKQGSGEQVDLGPMTSEKQLKIVEDHVQDALQRGAMLQIGGKRLYLRWCHEPTVLTNVDHSMKIMTEETFGPVLPIMTFKTEDDAIRLANDSIYGLTASVWTNDFSKGRTLANRIEAGTVMINEVVYTHALAPTPWGGVKQSGYGRTHGQLGLLELVTVQHVHLNRVPFVPDPWWFRYSPVARRLFDGLAKRFTTGSVLQGSLLLPQIIRRWFETRD